MTDLQKKFLQVLQLAAQQKSSDIHFMAGMPPALRMSEGLANVNCPPFSQDDLNQLIPFLLGNAQPRSAEELQDLDGSFDVKGVGRFRYNLYKTVQGSGIVLRVIPQTVPSIDDLKLPPVLRKIADASRGLILVTGATGSGKSSTLAAMIDYLNSTQSLHILTIEDPVEYLHSQKKCRMSQRELGRDTSSYAKALKSALRQDPDVILVGEMRDHETLDIALKAAETGHLVFSTVHTSDAMKTIGRLISLFPAAEQSIARIRLADNLHAIISQRLVPDVEGKRIVAQEIMINNFGIAECIMEETKTGDIPGFIEKGREVSGMQTFDQHLAEMTQKGLISIETALANSSNPTDFQRNLSFGNTATSITDTNAEGPGALLLEGNDSPALETATEKSPAPKAQPPMARAPLPPPAKAPAGLPKIPKIPKAA